MCLQKAIIGDKVTQGGIFYQYIILCTHVFGCLENICYICKKALTFPTDANEKTLARQSALGDRAPGAVLSRYLFL